MNILATFNDVKLFIFDVDGVLTDGSLILLNDGQMARTMNIKDGYALQLAIKKGYQILIVSGGNSQAVKDRLYKLGIENIFMGLTDKAGVVNSFLAKYKIDPKHALYMGDDLPDLLPMQCVQLICCPADAANEILKVAHYISPKEGGKGCVRDVIEKVLKLHNQWNETGVETIASK